jgi:hypothetical protein
MATLTWLRITKSSNALVPYSPLSYENATLGSVTTTPGAGAVDYTSSGGFLVTSDYGAACSAAGWFSGAVMVVTFNTADVTATQGNVRRINKVTIGAALTGQQAGALAFGYHSPSGYTYAQAVSDLGLS